MQLIRRPTLLHRACLHAYKVWQDFTAEKCFVETNNGSRNLYYILRGTLFVAIRYQQYSIWNIHGAFMSLFSVSFELYFNIPEASFNNTFFVTNSSAIFNLRRTNFALNFLFIYLQESRILKKKKKEKKKYSSFVDLLPSSFSPFFNSEHRGYLSRRSGLQVARSYQQCK